LFTLRIEIYQFLTVRPGYSALNMAAQFLRGLAAFYFVVAAVGFGRRFLNRRGKPLAFARDLSFPLYLLHFLPLSAATFLLLGTGMSVWARWTIAVLASWLFVALFTEFARLSPSLRRFFSIRLSHDS